MGAEYILVNYTKREIVSYRHIPASKARELAGNSISAAVTTWYLLQNRGDRIEFVSTFDSHFSLTEPWDKIWKYVDVTEMTVDSLIEAGILEDKGIAWADEDDPDNVYIRDLRNVWFE